MWAHSQIRTWVTTISELCVLLQLIGCLKMSYVHFHGTNEATARLIDHYASTTPISGWSQNESDECIPWHLSKYLSDTAGLIVVIVVLLQLIVGLKSSQLDFHGT
jgi:hypothetical protein